MEVISLLIGILIFFAVIKIFLLAFQLLFGIIILPFRLIGSLLGFIFALLLFGIIFSTGLIGIIVSLLMLFAPVLIVGIIILGILKFLFQ